MTHIDTTMSKYTRIRNGNVTGEEHEVELSGPSSASSSSSLPSSTSLPVDSDSDSYHGGLYLNENGNLISEKLTSLPARPVDWHYVAPIDPRRIAATAASSPSSSSSFEACPCGNQPNPCDTYYQNRSGFESKPSVSWWNRLTFSWISPLIATGFHRPLTPHKIPYIITIHTC